MKRQRTLLLIGLFAACQAVAQQPVAGTAVSKTPATRQQKFHQLAPAWMMETKDNQEPVKGLDVRAWTTKVGWHPGVSAFPDADAENYTWQLHVLSVGHEGWQ
jgi:hypothetical protein